MEAEMSVAVTTDISQAHQDEYLGGSLHPYDTTSSVV